MCLVVVLVQEAHLSAAGVNNMSADADNPYSLLQSQGLIDALRITTMNKPVRVEHTVPSDFRVAVYPDGVKRLQGAYRWQEGWNNQGFVWKDIPMVMVDDNGREIQ